MSLAEHAADVAPDRRCQLPGCKKASDLPRRTAHATHALIEAAEANRMAVTAAEVCIYDSEAINPRATGQALRHAAKCGLATYSGIGRGGYYWIPLTGALDLRLDLEERFLRDTAREDDE